MGAGVASCLIGALFGHKIRWFRFVEMASSKFTYRDRSLRFMVSASPSRGLGGIRTIHDGSYAPSSGVNVVLLCLAMLGAPCPHSEQCPCGIEI
jgi:ribosomal protein RSM22 (predicted rRNA methylase)